MKQSKKKMVLEIRNIKIESVNPGIRGFIGDFLSEIPFWIYGGLMRLEKSKHKNLIEFCISCISAVIGSLLIKQLERECSKIKLIYLLMETR